MLEKQLLTDIINGMRYHDVLIFLEYFIMDLISHRHNTLVRSTKDMDAIVKEAKDSTFKLLYSRKEFDYWEQEQEKQAKLEEQLEKEHNVGKITPEEIKKLKEDFKRRTGLDLVEAP